jgi:hypothetical protein
MVEEIITGLSRFRWLFVIARNSSFVYKGRAVDVKQVGRELGVRYLLEGSVRKSANRIRIAGQLIDASSGTHLWTDRFEGALEDVFELQDQVTASVVGAIAPRLQQAEIERARHKPIESLDAHDLYLRGLANVHKLTREGNEEALRLFYEAIEHDPNSSAAYASAAVCFGIRKRSGWVINRDQEVAEAGRLARRAVQLGNNDATVLCFAGFALALVANELDDDDGHRASLPRRQAQRLPARCCRRAVGHILDARRRGSAVVLLVETWADGRLPNRLAAGDGAGRHDQQLGVAKPAAEVRLAAQIGALVEPGQGDEGRPLPLPLCRMLMVLNSVLDAKVNSLVGGCRPKRSDVGARGADWGRVSG